MKARIKRFFNRVKKVINRPEMRILPGQLAFFLVLAIIPTLTLISYAASKLNLSMEFISNFLTRAFSSEISDVLLGVSTGSNVGFKLAFIIVMAYYLSSNGMASVIITSNTIYGIEESGWIKRRLKAILMSLIFGLVIIFLLLVPIFGNKIMDLILMVNLNSQVSDVIYKVFNYLQNPILIILLFVLIKIIYVLSPNRKIKSHNANYGAIFTTIAWILTTNIYSFYVNNFSNIKTFYGAWANVCVLMVWIYFISYFFVIGIALNYQKESEEFEETMNVKIPDSKKIKMK